MANLAARYIGGSGGPSKLMPTGSVGAQDADPESTPSRVSPSKVRDGRVGGVTVPVAKVARGVGRAVTVGKAIGKLGVAIATEPFTNRILNEQNKLIDTRLSNREADNHTAGLVTRYKQ